MATTTTPPPTVITPVWLTVKMIAVMFSVSQATVWRWVRDEKVVSKKVGGRRLILAHSVHDMFDRS